MLESKNFVKLSSRGMVGRANKGLSNEIREGFDLFGGSTGSLTKGKRVQTTPSAYTELKGLLLNPFDLVYPRKGNDRTAYLTCISAIPLLYVKEPLEH